MACLRLCSSRTEWQLAGCPSFRGGISRLADPGWEVSAPSEKRHAGAGAFAAGNGDDHCDWPPSRATQGCGRCERYARIATFCLPFVGSAPLGRQTIEIPCAHRTFGPGATRAASTRSRPNSSIFPTARSVSGRRTVRRSIFPSSSWALRISGTSEARSGGRLAPSGLRQSPNQAGRGKRRRRYDGAGGAGDRRND